MEFVLCDLSVLDADDFRLCMERCFDPSHKFLTQHAETITQLGANTLQSVWRSREMKADPMAIFTLLLLERYPERLTGEQKDRINTWEAKLCEKSEEVQARADSSQETALVRLQHFFAEHAHRIVQLEKETLREVVMSNQARSHEAWKHAQNFFLHQFDLLTVEKRDFLEDWEVVLCDLSPLDADAFRLCMESCFDRSRWFLMQHAETISSVELKACRVCCAAGS